MPHLYTLPLGAKSTLKRASDRWNKHFRANGTARCLLDQRLANCPVEFVEELTDLSEALWEAFEHRSDATPFLDQVAGILGGVLHCHHPGRLLTGLVFHHALIDLGLDVAGQETVEQFLGIRFVEVIPVMLDLVVGNGFQRQQLFDGRLLGPE